MALSPLMQRRLARFKANKRGLYSLWIFLILFGLSLIAEIITNDKPIFISYKGGWYTPMFKQYSEQEFGGDFASEADYTDPYVQELIKKDGFMIFPPLSYSYNTINYELSKPAPSAPDSANLLGTDDQGRDVLARLLYGFRISVIFGLLLTIGTSIIGIIAGAVQGYFGGWVDLIFQRIIEIWEGLPGLYIIIIIASIIEPNFWWLLLIMLALGWMGLVGVVRAEFLRARNFEYVKAAKAMGVPEIKIILRHILPNALVATISFMPFILGGAITSLAALDFLGFGLPTSYPSLGEVLRQGKANLNAYWLGISGFVIMGVLLSLLVFISEAVRDAFDSKAGIR